MNQLICPSHMSSALLPSLDSLAAWRRALGRGVEHFGAMLTDNGLLDAQAQTLLACVRQQLASERWVLAFVAEFSRGKSELINAMFFADTGRRLLPATPGRTTMCPVELAWDAQQMPSLALLPIASRTSGQTLAELRDQPALWVRMPLSLDDPDAMALTLEQVARAVHVPVDQARALGFWSDDQAEHNQPCDASGQVELPAWRHALINYPHPLLKRGLVVIDTPGLNAIGAEPELTLALLPSAHATVFLLAADTGVTRSDLSVWRDHLDGRVGERFVVLNKIDTLHDPLLDASQIEAQVANQCKQVAQTLGLAPEQVFALSARQALAARIQGDPAAVAASRLPALEQALLAQLLPQRGKALGLIVEDGLLSLQQAALRRLSDRRRQTAEQLIELQSLRGKSAARLKLMRARLDNEGSDFERCAPRLSALRAVLLRQLQALLDGLSSQLVSADLQRMQDNSDTSLFKLGAAKAFGAMGQQQQQRLRRATAQLDEIEAMLQASLRSLNADFGFALRSGQRPVLDRYKQELGVIENSYSRYVGLTQIWRLAQAGFMARFSQILLSRLRVVFDGAAQDIELWAKAISTQIDDQLRERRRSLQQRREAHQRIKQAEDGLELSIASLEAQQAQQQALAQHMAREVDRLSLQANAPPAPDRASHLQLVPWLPTQPERDAA